MCKNKPTSTRQRATRGEIAIAETKPLGGWLRCGVSTMEIAKTNPLGDRCGHAEITKRSQMIEENEGFRENSYRIACRKIAKTNPLMAILKRVV
jgi:hypothetical protein